jgi:hypothetical protein
MHISHHAAAGVMRGRHHRDRLFADIYAQLQTAFIDVGEV